MEKLVQLQAQQLNAIHTIASNTSKNNSVNVGHQPNAQYMSDYVNYSPEYAPPMFPFSPSTQAARQQFRGSISQLNMPQAGFIDSVFVDRNRVNQHQMDQIRTDYGSRLGDAAISGAKFGTSAAGSILGTALVPGLVGGIAGGVVGGAAVGGLFNIGLNQAQQHASINQYLLRESYRFINPRESTNTRDIAGFDQSQRWGAARFLRHMNTEKGITDQETTTLMAKFTEGGLLKDVKDLETFQNKMSKLTDYVKKSALILNKTFEDVAGLMSEMNKSGISSQNFDYFASRSKVLGSFTGRSADEFMQSSFALGEQLRQGTTLSPTNSMQVAGDTIAYVSSMYDKSKIMQGSDPRQRELFNYISNIGGVNQASSMTISYMQQFLNRGEVIGAGLNFFDWSEDTKSFVFNPESFKSFAASGSTLEQLTNKGTAKLNELRDKGNIAASNEWVNRAGKILGGLSAAEQSKIATTISQAAKRQLGDPSLRNADLSYEQILSLAFGDNSDAGRLFGNFLNYQEADNGKLLRDAANLTRQQDLLADINANRKGAWRTFVRDPWEKFKDTVGDRFTPVTEMAVGAVTKVSDWLTGTKYDSANLGQGRSFSIEARETGKEVYKEIIKGVKEGMQDLKRQGADISNEMISSFETARGEYKSNYSFATRSDYITGDTAKNIRKHFDLYHVNALINDPKVKEMDLNKMREHMAYAYGIDMDKGVSSKLSANQKFAERQVEIQNMLRDYDSEKDNKGNTQWGKMDVYQKSNLLVELNYLRTSSDPNYSGAMPTEQYFTDKDRLEASRIQKRGGFFGIGSKLTLVGAEEGDRYKPVDIDTVNKFTEDPNHEKIKGSGSIKDMKKAAEKAQEEREKLMVKSQGELVSIISEINDDKYLNTSQKREFESLTLAAMSGDEGDVKNLKNFIDNFEKENPNIKTGMGPFTKEGEKGRGSLALMGKTLDSATRLAKSKIYTDAELFPQVMKDYEEQVKLVSGVGGVMLKYLGGSQKDIAKLALMGTSESIENSPNLETLLTDQEKLIAGNLGKLVVGKDDDNEAIEKKTQKQDAFFEKILGPGNEHRREALKADLIEASYHDSSSDEQKKILMDVVRNVMTTVDAPGSEAGDLKGGWTDLQTSVKSVIDSMSNLQKDLDERLGKIEGKSAGTASSSVTPNNEGTSWFDRNVPKLWNWVPGL